MRIIKKLFFTQVYSGSP